ncbi:MAG: putative peptidoglycan glycosyltransferase FtsW, partial [Acidimicrobiia bacterium]
EGLYFEASMTTPFHFLNQALLSANPSRAMRNMPYQGRFQPSEAAKFLLVLLLARLLTNRSNEIGDWRKALAPALTIFGAFAVLVMLEPDMDTTIVCALVLGSMLVAAGIPARQIARLAGGGLAVAAVLAVAAPYRRARVLSFLDPWKDRTNRGWQLVQSQIAIGTGGWTGVGLGASRSKWSFLPNAHTDFIFAIIAEELGLIGALCVLALIVMIAVLGMRAAFRAPDRAGLLIAVGITTWFVGQALINIGAVVGLIPVSGITLPFVSFGGSSLLFTMVAAGVLANIARLGAPAPLPRGRASLRPVRS